MDAAHRLLHGRPLGLRQAEAPGYVAVLAASLWGTGSPRASVLVNVVVVAIAAGVLLDHMEGPA